jgi:sulfonate transport system substrate-binding protein
VLRLGYFANLTHAVPLLGLARGAFASALGSTRIETQVFNAGPAAVEALLSGALDAAYLGPSPAVNAYVRTKRTGVRVVAGGATGGAALVVRPGITSVEQLRGTTLASPQLGGTQDVALRTYLRAHGLLTETTGGEDVSVVAQQNAQTLDLFQAGTIDGAWLPEPWVSRLVLDAGARVLVDEASLWPDGVFPTTQLMVTQAYLQTFPDVVRSLVSSHVDQVLWARAHAHEAADLANTEVGKIAGKPLSKAVLDRAYARITLGWDPAASTMTTLAKAAVDAGTTPRNPDLAGLLDLRPLQGVLTQRGQAPVSGAGLEIT